MCVVWSVTLRVRRAPQKTTPVLMHCDSAEGAFTLARELLKEGFPPYHMKYLSAARIHEINELLHSSEAKISERESLLVAFDDAESARYGVHLASEAYFVGDGQALLLPVFTFHARNALAELYTASLSLVLTKLGIALGGRPYVIGIWNTPFARAKFGEKFDTLRAYKSKIDLDGLFNPRKFFTLPAPWSSLALRQLRPRLPSIYL
jgi:FAD/FMN-containing dehydrogenase